ncbi:MAG TPA: cytochrome c oxidase assembly protein [Streptosporangiaceae bacterium]|jgi:putative copper resistance protein D
MPPFGWSAVVTQWQFAPVVTGFAAVAAAAYLWGVVRVARRHPARPWPAWRTGMFLAGLAVVVLATESGIGGYDDVLFWDHMVQHLMLLMIAPPLLIFGQPVTLLLHASRNPLHTWAKRLIRSRVVSFLTWPVFGLVAYCAAVAAAHLTGLADVIERNELAHNAEHAAFLVIGYLFFLPIIGSEPIRWRLSYPVRFVILVLVMPVDTFTGLVLGYGNAGTPGISTAGRPSWAPSAVADLHAGGAVMWVAGDGIMFGLMMIVYLLWSMDDRAATRGHGWLEAARRASLANLVASHPARPAAVPGQQPAAAGEGSAGSTAAAGGAAGAQASPDGQAAAATADPVWTEGRGGIDDDEHLAAYNAFLARLNEAESGRRR